MPTIKLINRHLTNHTYDILYLFTIGVNTTYVLQTFNKNHAIFVLALWSSPHHCERCYDILHDTFHINVSPLSTYQFSNKLKLIGKSFIQCKKDMTIQHMRKEHCNELILLVCSLRYSFG